MNHELGPENKKGGEMSYADEIAKRHGITHDGQHFIISIKMANNKDVTIHLPLWDKMPVGNSKAEKNLKLANVPHFPVEDVIKAHLKYLPEYEEDPGSFELMRRFNEDSLKEKKKKSTS